MSRQSSLRKVIGGLAVAGGAGVAAYAFAIGPWHRRWGATDAEISRALPGDQMVPDANFATTRALTIHAPPEKVCPWLVQIGQGRAGFYSYDLLENMMGLNIYSADQIVPELQDLEAGDTIPLEPEGSGYTVAEVEPNHYLLLYTGAKGEGILDQVFQEADAASTWLFFLEKRDVEHTRLIVRWRARWKRLASPTSFLIGVFLDPIEFIMERKMLRGIRQRAETAELDRSKESLTEAQ